jgi:hypothetical protein
MPLTDPRYFDNFMPCTEQIRLAKSTVTAPHQGNVQTNTYSRCPVLSFDDDKIVCQMPQFKPPSTYTYDDYNLASQNMHIEVEVLGERAFSAQPIFNYEAGLAVASVSPLISDTAGGGVLTIEGTNFRHAEYSGDYQAAGYAPFQVVIGHRRCPIISQSETKIECRIPSGFGTHHAVKIEQAHQDGVVFERPFQAAAAQDGTDTTASNPLLKLDMADASKYFELDANENIVGLNKGVLHVPNTANDATEHNYITEGSQLDTSEIIRGAGTCTQKHLLRATPCGIYTCGCVNDYRKMQKQGSIAVFSYTEPILVEVGKTYDAVANSDGGMAYASVAKSINGEMGSVGRGAAEAVPRMAEGQPSGGEWIEVTARNLPPYKELVEQMQAGRFRFYFGRLFDHENNGDSGKTIRDDAATDRDGAVELNNDHASDIRFGTSAKDTNGNYGAGAFHYGGAPIDNTVFAQAGYLQAGALTANGDELKSWYGGNVYGGTTSAYGTVERKSCAYKDLVLMEAETLTRPARFMCRTPPGCDMVQVNAHLAPQAHTDGEDGAGAHATVVKGDMACTGVAVPQVSCQDVKFKYLEPYICDWYEPSCGTIFLVGRNMPGVGIGETAAGGNEPAALDVEVVLQEYDSFVGAWTDRARCGNLQRSLDETGTKVDHKDAALSYNNNEKEILNDAFGSTRPDQRASQLGSLEKDYKPWTASGNPDTNVAYTTGDKITYNGKCYVATSKESGTGAANEPIPNGIPPSIATATSSYTNYWAEVRCPHHTAVDYITAPYDADVLRPDFSCRLPAVFWERNAARRFDSPVHDRFRFKVRGCFLHEASYYSASADQRTCKTTAAGGYDEPKTALGYVAPNASDAGAVSATVSYTPSLTGTTRVILADMIVAGDSSSFYDVSFFGNPQRALVLNEMSKALGLRPNSILLETATQSGATGKVQVAVVTSTDSMATVENILSGATSSDLQSRLVAGLNTLSAGPGVKVGAVTFSNARDMLQYQGSKNVLSSSVVLSGVNPSNVISSSSFRDATRDAIAAKLGVDVVAVQITSVKQQSSGRRLGAASTERRLADDAGSVVVSFTVVTDADTTSAMSAEQISAKLQESINDGTLTKSVNAKTGLAFSSAEMGSTSNVAATSATTVDYQAWATATTIIMVVLLIIVLILVIRLANAGKGGAGSPTSAAFDSEGGMELPSASSNMGVGAAQAMNSNPSYGHRKDDEYKKR